MYNKGNEKRNLNYQKDKILKDKTVKKNGNHSIAMKHLKGTKNLHSLIEPHKISLLLIYFIIIIKINVSNSIRFRKLNQLNEIQIKN